ncbi:DUF6273 domain-containing protein [Paenibacillus pasadenensis]|uniref:DUF6273 domain-containing protein n=1 Tax=Paenibacillus pasadenensis TaxID=217090 RepID=UPI00203E2B5C|nr:DUF6273 domain-containing protein [Paenibacillus pasadenensis]MCM3748828.1 DUF6273 domain-containing protein [Paenibacillus pasadenensis]
MHQHAKPGEIITFGTYPQSERGMDKTPIRWIVLQNRGTELFLLSERILDCKRYHSEFTDTSWQECDLRKWLNDGFYNTAFNEDEKSLIKTTLCTGNGEGSPDTEDNVFLLSVEEAQEWTVKAEQAGLSVRRRTIGTDFSKVKKNDGCYLYVYDKKVEADYIVEDGAAYGCSWWWLRTQDNRSSRAYFIGPRSSIRSYARVNLARDGVRPALKITLK